MRMVGSPVGDDARVLRGACNRRADSFVKAGNAVWIRIAALRRLRVRLRAPPAASVCGSRNGTPSSVWLIVTSTSKIRRMVSAVMASVRPPSIASLPRCSSTIRSAKRIARLRSCRIAITAVPSARAPPCGFHQVDLVPQVEARGRLVQQQQAGAVQRLAAGELHQHAGKMRALLLAAGQRRQLAGGGNLPARPRAAPRRPAAARRRGRGRRRPCARSPRP